jgi:cell wall-associated NlpC family hydrolase
MKKNYLGIPFSEKKRILEMHKKHSNLIIEQDDEMDLYARTMVDNPDYESERQKVKLVPKTTTTTTTMPQDVVRIKDKPLDTDIPVLDSNEFEPQIVKDSRKYLGSPYVMGSQGTKTFDCSGFVRRMLYEMGIIESITDTKKVGRKAVDLYNSPNVTKKTLSEVKPGDLVFFGKGSSVSHVGLVSKIDENEQGERIFHMIHASSSSGVQDTEKTNYTKNGVNKTPYWANKIKGFGEVV